MSFGSQRRNRVGRWLFRGALAAVACPLLLLADVAQSEGALDAGVVESQIEAAYLLKFANYVEWPSEAFSGSESPIVMGILGDEGVAAQVEQLADRKVVQGRPFVTRRIKLGDPVDDLHILFIGEVEGSITDELLGSVGDRPVLTVSNSRQVHARGSMVNFTLINQRVRFEVAMQPVAHSRLRLSALMLTAAYRIQEARP